MKISCVNPALVLFLCLISHSVFANTGLLVIKSNNIGMEIHAGSDNQILLFEKMTTLHPALWNISPNFTLNTSPVAFIYTMLNSIHLTEKTKKGLTLNNEYVLYLSATGYDKATNPDNIISFTHKQDTFRQAIKNIIGENLHKKIELRQCYNNNYKGDFFACAFSAILEDVLNINISTIVVEHTTNYILESDDLELDKKHNFQEPNILNQFIQVSNLSCPYFGQNKGDSSDSFCMPDHNDEVSLKVLPKYNNCLSYYYELTDKDLFSFLCATLHSESNQGSYPIAKNILCYKIHHKDNQFPRFLLNLPTTYKLESTHTASPLEINKQAIISRPWKVSLPVNPEKIQSLISTIYFNHIINQ